MSTFLNWELFSDKDILDAQKAFCHIATNFHYSSFSDDAVISQVLKVISSKSTSLKIKVSMANSFLIMLKNINFKKQLLS